MVLDRVPVGVPLGQPVHKRSMHQEQTRGRGLPHLKCDIVFSQASP
jgi:hypothetical protein